MIADIYSQELMYYYKNQPFHKDLKEFSLFGRDANFSCGDSISIKLLVDKNGKIKDVGYKADGCVISTASMSFLAEFLVDKDISIAKNLSPKDMLELIGIELTPSREKCALVGFNALHSAVNSLGNNSNGK